MDSFGDAIAGLFEGLADLASSLVRGSASPIAAVMQLLGFSVSRLSHKPTEDDPRRFTWQQIGVALLPWGIVAATFVGLYGWIQWRHHVTQRRIADTQTLVNQTRDALAVIDHNGESFVALPAGYQPPSDAWGNPLRIEVRDGVASHLFHVGSDGPDEAPGGFDDITAERVLPKGKLETAGNVTRLLLDKLMD